MSNLLEVVTLKRLCRAAGVEKLEAGPKGMVLQFRNNKFGNPAGLVAWLGTTKGTVKVRPDQKLALVRDMNLSERIRSAKEILGNLTRISGQAQAA